MSNEFPDYLRLHIEETPRPTLPDAEEIQGLRAFCQSFQQATGWQLSLEPLAGGFSAAEVEPRNLSRFSISVSPPAADTASDAQPPIAHAAAQELAGSFAEFLDELTRTRQELLCREAELAAGVPVTPRQDEEAHLALRLEAVLKGGAEAVGCQVAAFYALDEATTQLKLRAFWGLDPRRLLEPARPLRGAVADLEALVGHAVVIEDTSMLPHWRVPEEFPAAVCVPVSSPSEPLGTLWVFCDHVRPFTSEQTNLIEIIAGRIAAELQREILLSDCVSSKQLDRQLARAARWQHDRLPNVKPLLDGWQLAGAIHSTELLGSAFYDWFVPPDGSLAIALGSADGTLLESALTTASLQSIVRSHGEQTSNATELVTRVNETFWNCSAGGQFASLFYATIGPDSGELMYASAGHTHACLVRAGGVQPLTSTSPPLGTEPYHQSVLCEEELREGEAIVILNSDSNRQLPDLSFLAARRAGSAEQLAAAVRAALPHSCGDESTAEWTVLVVKRTEPDH